MRGQHARLGHGLEIEDVERLPGRLDQFRRQFVRQDFLRQHGKNPGTGNDRHTGQVPQESPPGGEAPTA